MTEKELPNVFKFKYKDNDAVLTATRTSESTYRVTWPGPMGDGVSHYYSRQIPAYIACRDWVIISENPEKTTGDYLTVLISGETFIADTRHSAFDLIERVKGLLQADSYLDEHRIEWSGV